MQSQRTRIRGFSMVELVIVIVIIGVIAAIAVPRISRGARGANDAALRADLAILRNAIDLYAAEHGGNYPLLASFEAQMTTFTDAGGGDSATKDTTHIYGPYLKAVPPLPVGADAGKKTLVASYTAGNGWVYDQVAGDISANTDPTELDEAGTAYNTY